MKKLLILVALLTITTSCKREGDWLRFKEEYEGLNGTTSVSGQEYLSINISKDNVIKYSTIDELIHILNSGTGVIYLGYPECSWCRSAVDCLLYAADSTELDTIYYLNMLNVRDRLSLDSDGNIMTEVEASEGYYDLVEVLSPILDDYILTSSNGDSVNTGKKRIYVPIVIFVKDGNIVYHHVNTVSTQIDPYVSLTDEEKDELINIYKDGIMKTIN